jgi:hypothetical protein
MANSTARTGFKLAYNIFGKVEAQVLAYPAGKTRDATGGEIFIGDVVQLSSGLATPAVGVATTTGMINVLGVVVGVSPMPGNPTPTALNSMNAAPPFNPDSLQARSLPATIAGWVYVIPAAGNVFSTVNVSATAIAQIGANATLVGTAGTITTASTAHGILTGVDGYTGNSTHAIDSGAATPGDIRIVGVYNNFPGTPFTGQTDPSAVNGAVLVMLRNPVFTN